MQTIPLIRRIYAALEATATAAVNNILRMGAANCVLDTFKAYTSSQSKQTMCLSQKPFCRRSVKMHTMKIAL